MESRKIIPTAWLLSAAGLLLMAGCWFSESRSLSTGSSSPVTVQRLKDSRLESIRGDLTWRFIGNGLVIENNGEPLPHDLVQDLTGKPATPNRIEASWTLNEKSDMILLSDLKLDGEEVPGDLKILIQPAGHVRVNLGSRQYNLFPGRAHDP